MADVLETKLVLENMWDVGRDHTCTLISLWQDLLEAGTVGIDLEEHDPASVE